MDLGVPTLSESTTSCMGPLDHEHRQLNPAMCGLALTDCRSVAVVVPDSRLREELLDIVGCSGAVWNKVAINASGPLPMGPEVIHVSAPVFE